MTADDFDMRLASLGEADAMLTLVERELFAIGHVNALPLRTAGVSAVEALWKIAPTGTPVGGAVWHRLWRGVQVAYGLADGKGSP